MLADEGYEGGRFWVDLDASYDGQPFKDGPYGSFACATDGGPLLQMPDLRTCMGIAFWSDHQAVSLS